MKFFENGDIFYLREVLITALNLLTTQLKFVILHKHAYHKSLLCQKKNIQEKFKKFKE